MTDLAARGPATDRPGATAPLGGDPAHWWHHAADGRVQCDVCPRTCRLREGQRGFCYVRMNRENHLVLDTYGRSSGFCLDPVEKKPLNHFLPGTAVLSFGTAGCNLGCKFCQNWDISTARTIDRLVEDASPAAIARAARAGGARSVAFTYNDPVIFAEYAIDTAAACREVGIASIAVTAGYVCEEPRRALFAAMDATNIDLKTFEDSTYRKLTGARLASVLDTLAFVRHETDAWLEITTLLIPGHNDSDAELGAMTRWIHDELGADVPLHFSAFHPDNRMRDVPPTPPATLARARRIALDEGLHYVYTGNIVDPRGEVTSCPSCGAALVERDRYEILAYRLQDGACARCATVIPGRFERVPGDFGRRRLPLRLAR